MLGRFAATLLMTLLAGCGKPRDGVEPLTAALRSEAPVLVLQGLPNPLFDSDLVDDLVRTDPVDALHGHGFYKQPFVLDAATRVEVIGVLGNPASYQSFSGEKLCGGFHPDFALRVGAIGRTVDVLVCFSCDEAKIFGPGIGSRHDLTKEAVAKLEALL